MGHLRAIAGSGKIVTVVAGVFRTIFSGNTGPASIPSKAQ